MVTYWTRPLVGALVVLALVFGGIAGTVRPGRAAVQDEPPSLKKQGYARRFSSIRT